MAGITDPNPRYFEDWGSDSSTSPKTLQLTETSLGPNFSSPYYCNVCRVEMTGPEPLHQHMQGSSHAKQVKRQVMLNAAAAVPNGGCLTREENGLQKNSVAAPVQVDVPTVTGSQTYHCSVCKTTMSGIEPYMQHIKGMQHMKRQRRVEQEKALLDSQTSATRDEHATQQRNVYPSPIARPVSQPPQLLMSTAGIPSYYCTICNISMSGMEPYNQHMKGIPHLKRVKNQEQMALHVAQITQQQVAIAPSNFYCKLCNKHMSGYEPYMAHMKGSQHAKEENRQKIMTQVLADSNPMVSALRCDVCVKSFSGIESLQAHFRSVKHLKKIEQSGSTMDFQSESEIDKLSGLIASQLSIKQEDLDDAKSFANSDDPISVIGADQDPKRIFACL